MTWGNTMTKTKTAPMRFEMCRDETRRGRTRSPLAAGRNQTKADEGDDEGKDDADEESRRRKPKEKAEDEDEDRDKKNNNKKKTGEA